ncbi:MAG: hypothetical protein IAE83_09505 [Anaerolinea sp.]|nr:hypothetical protein [Anaerolinea sp.]
MSNLILFPTTIREWVLQKTGRDVPLHHLARALGVSRERATALLDAAPTAESLLELNHLAQLHLLALTDRAWPHCSWFEWEYREKPHPVLDLIWNVFGQDLLRLVEQVYGDEIVTEYWNALESPIDDLNLPPETDEDDDPFDFIPEDQWVENPHTEEDEEQQVFIFGSPHTAACFRWLIADRQHYTIYVDNLTSYLHDPLGVQLAYDLRHTLQEEYWATLPPDTFPAYHAIARALQSAIVPEEWRVGSLPLLSIRKVASLPTQRLEIVQTDQEDLWWVKGDVLEFQSSPVNVFVVDSNTEEAPAALILTTHPDPGNPEQHCQSFNLRTLTNSTETLFLALVPGAEAEKEIDLAAVEDVMIEVLDGETYGLHQESGIFCACRDTPWSQYGDDRPISVYKITGGYMLQFNHHYRFTPSEMEVG